VTDGGDPDAALDELLDRLHAELRATEEAPVEREASRWIGEAQAVAADAATGGLDDAVVRKRVAHVAELLDNVDGTGSDAADDHVATAQALAAKIRDRE